jgi:hypothetical protein
MIPEISSKKINSTGMSTVFVNSQSKIKIIVILHFKSFNIKANDGKKWKQSHYKECYVEAASFLQENTIEATGAGIHFWDAA